MLAFEALADSTRRQIVEMLSHRELSAGEIAGKFEMSAPAISQHLKVLRESHVVNVRISAQRRIYSIDPTGLAEIDDWLGRVRRFWAGRLDTLEKQLKEKHDD
jgi:DNA-binding transcriptional ArsR family regulator